MKVYVLVREVDYCPSTVFGCFSTRELAESHAAEKNRRAEVRGIKVSGKVWVDTVWEVLEVTLDEVTDELKRAEEPMKREAPEILRAAWEIVEGQAYGALQRRTQRIAEMLLAAWQAQENRLPEAAIHALEEAYRQVATFGGEWPETLLPLRNAVRQRFGLALRQPDYSAKNREVIVDADSLYYLLNCIGAHVPESASTEVRERAAMMREALTHIIEPPSGLASATLDASWPGVRPSNLRRATGDRLAPKDGPCVVSVHYFKPTSGKWYCEDEDVVWLPDSKHFTGWQSFRELHRLKDMTAVCMLTPLGHPQSSPGDLAAWKAAAHG